MKELLLEIGTEEIPSGYLPGALNNMEETACRLLKESRLPFNGVFAYGTPRRLLLHVTGLAGKQEELTREVVGPPKSVAYDEKGNPKPAALGFAKKQGISIDKLTIVKKDKGEYLFCRIVEKGTKTEKVLKELIPCFIEGLSFPKTMRWGEGAFRFVRPLHRVTALLDGKFLLFKVGGVKSGNFSKGHPFLAPRKFVFKDFKSYVEKARSHFVIVDGEERRKIIEKEARKLAAKVKGVILEDEELMESLAFLTEYPVPVRGEFEKGYLSLPQEVLVAVMKKHQRYLSLTNEKGKLLHYFIAVSDNKVKNAKVLKQGFERVLRARLSDANHFYEEDKKVSLAEYALRLDSVLWQDKLGNLREKVERVKRVGKGLTSILYPGKEELYERAAELSKADLMSQMVYEFPELQGIMGREYAKIAGEKEEVSTAMFEQYLPRFAGDLLPEKPLGALLSVTDKMDSIVGCFAVGRIPSGSEDPLALRRQALGVINTLLEKEWPLPLSELISKTYDGYGGRFDEKRLKVVEQITEFFKGRLRQQMISDGTPYDVVEAAFASGFDLLSDDVKRAKALEGAKKGLHFDALVTTFKRVENIIKSKESFSSVDEGLLKEESERGLYKKFQKIRRNALQLFEKKNYEESLQKMALIKDEVDRFFDEVMVMDKDERVKENRLALLKEISLIYRKIGDFTKIVVN